MPRQCWGSSGRWPCGPWTPAPPGSGPFPTLLPSAPPGFRDSLHSSVLPALPCRLHSDLASGWQGGCVSSWRGQGWGPGRRRPGGGQDLTLLPPRTPHPRPGATVREAAWGHFSAQEAESPARGRASGERPAVNRRGRRDPRPAVPPRSSLPRARHRHLAKAPLPSPHRPLGGQSGPGLQAPEGEGPRRASHVLFDEQETCSPGRAGGNAGGLTARR